MAGNKDDEVMIEDQIDGDLDVELEPEGSEEGAGAEDGKATESEDKAPKTAAATKEQSGEADEETRERRRVERKERKERQREARAKSDAELAEYRERSLRLEKEVAELKAKTSTSETSAAMNKALSDLQVVESVIAKATEDGNGKQLVEAMRVRDTISQHIYALKQQKAPAQQQPAPAATGLHPTVKAHIDQFAADHPWYKLSGNDEDSLMVRAIDKAVAAEGFDPGTQDYWDELRDRVQQKLGNRGGVVTTTNQGKPASKGGPQVGSGRSTVMPGRQTYTLSAERLNAMREANIDVTNPAELKKWAGIYQKHDRENANQ